MLLETRNRWRYLARLLGVCLAAALAASEGALAARRVLHAEAPGGHGDHPAAASPALTPS